MARQMTDQLACDWFVERKLLEQRIEELEKGIQVCSFATLWELLNTHPSIHPFFFIL